MITPGDYLTQWLKDNDMTIVEASDHFDISIKTMRKLLDNQISFRGYSKRAEQLTSIPQDHWLTLQEEYEKKQLLSRNKDF